jgi:hypothetical protein
VGRPSLTYDELNRVKTKQPAGEAAVSYIRRSGIQQQQGTVDDARGRFGTTNFSYKPSADGAYSKHIDGERLLQQFTYDGADRVTQVTYSNGSYDYTYTGEAVTCRCRRERSQHSDLDGL